MYDIFISYRRLGGYETALPIVEKLRSAGYKVFFDLESLNSGLFNKQLLNVIDQCKDFIVVLPEGGLDRCIDKDDWVRQEVEEAMRLNKNIIPVLLKGFEWPDNLPDSLKDLPNYQGVSATTPEYFDLTIKRLRGYLKSKPHTPIGRWAKIGLIIVSVLAILLTIGYFTVKQVSKPFMDEAATQLTMNTDIIHQMIEVQEELQKEMDIYFNRMLNSSNATSQRLKDDMLERIDTYYIPEITRIENSYTSNLEPSSFKTFVLGIYDIDPTDIYSLDYITEAHAEEFRSNFKLYRTFIEYNAQTSENLQTIHDCFKADEYGKNINYYAYLSVLTKFPESSKKSHKIASQKWTLFPNISESLKSDEYENMAKKELEKLQKYSNSKEILLGVQSSHISEMEDRLNEMENALEEFENDVPSDEYTDNELLKIKQEILAQYDTFKRINQIKASDDQWKKWGKVTASAKLFTDNMQANAEAEKIGMKPVIPDDEVYRFLIKQIDDYQKYHPESEMYVKAVKALYKGVKAGLQTMNGLVVIGTDGNREHPLIKVGDIIISRNNRDEMKTIEQYVDAAKLKSPGNVVLLRLDGSNEVKLAVDMPATDVTFGLLEITNS